MRKLVCRGDLASVVHNEGQERDLPRSLDGVGEFPLVPRTGTGLSTRQYRATVIRVLPQPTALEIYVDRLIGAEPAYLPTAAPSSRLVPVAVAIPISTPVAAAGWLVHIALLLLLLAEQINVFG